MSKHKKRMEIFEHNIIFSKDIKHTVYVWLLKSRQWVGRSKFDGKIMSFKEDGLQYFKFGEKNFTSVCNH